MSGEFSNCERQVIEYLEMANNILIGGIHDGSKESLSLTIEVAKMIQLQDMQDSSRH
jgi:hypothetical protein